MRVLFDTNVVLDVLLARVPHVAPATALLDRVAGKALDGLLGATTLTTIHCLARKAVGPRAAKGHLRTLRRTVCAPCQAAKGRQMRFSVHRAAMHCLLVAVLLSCRDNTGPSTTRSTPVPLPRPAVTDSTSLWQDTYVSTKYPDIIHGFDAALLIERKGQHYSEILISVSQESLIQKVGDDSLVSATLRLNVNDSDNKWGSGRWLDIHRVSNFEWTQSATWNCANSGIEGCDPLDNWEGAVRREPVASDSVLMTNGESGTLSFDVTEDVRLFTSGALPNRGWWLRKRVPTDDGTVSLISTEGAINLNWLFLETVPTTPVPGTAPDTVPAWVYADSNVGAPSSIIAGNYLRNIVVVEFVPGATEAARSAAIASVTGTVVGGIPIVGGEGYYFIRIADTTVGGQDLLDAAAALRGLEDVHSASIEVEMGFQYVKPNDGPGWNSWAVNPEEAGGDNWALERIAAPLAWTCTTGDPSVPIAVVDGGSSLTSGPHDLSGMSVRYSPSNTTQITSGYHGVGIASILFAEGDNQGGMTGVMWSANRTFYDVTIPLSLTHAGGARPWLMSGVAMIKQAALDGNRVINVSMGVRSQDGSQANLNLAVEVAQALAQVLRGLTSFHGQDPLVVLAAGNSPYDAGYNGYPLVNIADMNRRVLVVAASDVNDAFMTNGNNGGLVEVAAPGVGVFGLGPSLTTPEVLAPGTSNAAPFVAGIAGLAFAFDPTLSAGQVHDAIIAGAIAGGRYTTDVEYPIANAYETLKVLAASSTTSPLCGNRVWSGSGGALSVERSSGPQVIWDFLDDLREIGVRYGGRIIEVYDQDFNPFVLEYSVGAQGWVPGDPSSATGALNGAFLSSYGRSPDGDTLVTLNGRPDFLGDGPMDVVLQSSMGTESIGDIPADFSIPPPAPGSSVHEIIDYRIAFDSFNRRLFIGVSYIGETNTGGGGPRCSNATYAANRAEVWSMDLATGQSGRIYDSTGVVVRAVGVSQDGAELFMVVSGHNGFRGCEPVSESYAAPGCTIFFRGSAAPYPIRRTVPTEDACVPDDGPSVGSRVGATSAVRR